MAERQIAEQTELFGSASALPQGFNYTEELISETDEAELLARIGAMQLQEAQYKEWTAKRRTVSYGGRYDFSRNELLPAGPIPAFLEPLRKRMAAWSGIAAAKFTHALIAEYRPGTQLGWHRDVPAFEAIVGLSLGGEARLRLRPFPPSPGARAALTLDLAPRSAYAMLGPARWNWQHAISPTKSLRYSITFRSLADT